MDLMLTYAELKALDPCAESLRRVANLMGGARKWTAGITAAQAREAGATFDDLVWVSSAVACTNPNVDRRLRLWMADCAARVLHIYEAAEKSDAPRAAIVAARQYARGEIDDAARAATRDAAWAAAWAATRDAAWAATRDAARAATRDAAWAAERAAARAAEESWQFDRLVLRLSADEPLDWPLPDVPMREVAT